MQPEPDHTPLPHSAAGHPRRVRGLLLAWILAVFTVLALAAWSDGTPFLAQDSPLVSPLAGSGPGEESAPPVTAIPPVFAQPAPPSPLPTPLVVAEVPSENRQIEPAEAATASTIPTGEPLRVHTSMALVGLLLAGLVGLVLVIALRPGE